MADIDTLKLKFPIQSFNADFFNEKIRGKDGWTNNTWRKERRALGLYVPKFSVELDYIHPSKKYLYLEFSAPKLLNGTNTLAITDCQLDELIKAVVDFCQEIGQFIFSEQIKHCQPTLIALGRNINLTALCSANNALRVLACFDYKSRNKHRLVDFSDRPHGGREVIYSIKEETLKAYDKNREILNNAETKEEKALAKLIGQGEFMLENRLAKETLRIELTLKTSRKIKQKFKKHLGVLPPTLENIFKPAIWEQILREQIEEIFNHPLQKIIFLALEKQPVIDDFLDKHYKHIQTKATIRQMIGELQEKGLAKTRQDYLRRYKSRQTWYNYLGRLARLQKYFDWQELAKLDNVKIHKYILEQFGIISTYQQELGLKFALPVSKIIDTARRNSLLQMHWLRLC